jgi:NifU-like protein involved in Fe-S cluster formation
MINREVLEEAGLELTDVQIKQIQEHLKNTKNNKALEVYNARGVGRNPDNYGLVEIYLQVNEKEYIDDIGFKYKGCATIEFTASVYTQDLKGASLDEALEITNMYLDEMNSQEDSDECLKMILVAFLAARENFLNRKNGIDEECHTKII